LSWHGLSLHVPEFWRGIIQTVSWGIALVWVLRTYDAIHLLPTVPELTMPDWNVTPVGTPTLTVVVPARDEAENIAATLDALLLADYPGLRILVVDDRSTDGTGAIVDTYVAEYAERMPGRLEAIHVAELPEGWLGKTFALMVATENSDSDYLLFTDADVLFSPSILRRALVYAQDTDADHVVVMPTVQVRSRGEGIVLGFLQIFGVWVSRPWKIDDPKARRDVVGVGAFNLVRREALNEIGGWLPQRLAVLEDITLGRRMKAAGMRQRIAFAPGLVLVHWAKGARGVLRAMTKNLFSAFNFRPLMLLLVWMWIAVFCLLPLVGLAWPPTMLPALVVVCCIGALYRVMGAESLIDARYAWLYPLGALALMYAMVQSMVVVWARRGVVWRGTHYPLRDLRRHNSPFVWERAARKKRDEEIRTAAVVRRLAKKGKSKS
jgi:cellulose synthase/poly-beta-1,6-N-acetylglucosamine synthase-like glycosyltransferase